MEIRIEPTGTTMDPNTTVVFPCFDGDDFDSTTLWRRVRPDAVNVLRTRQALLEPYELVHVHGTSDSPGVAVVSAGARSDFDLFYLARACAAASRYLTARGLSRFAVVDTRVASPEDWAIAVTSGMIKGAYSPALKKTRDARPREIAALTLWSDRTNDTTSTGAEVGRVLGESANLARDLVNTPPNDLTPRIFAQRAQQLAEECGLGCDVLDEEAILRRGMGSLLGVAQGSSQPPRVIILRCGSPDAPMRLAFVGKGITFDSGGLSLKTSEGMETMKGDMGGGAAVVAGMVGVARLGLTGISVTGYVGATENMPGGNAMRPGDVLTAITGETIEVLNTDAEGRLVLADVLGLAVHEGATHIVDFATLTGGAVVALGQAATLAVGRPADWVSEVVSAARSGLERAWQMPIYREYREAMKSNVADIKNSGGRYGSALTASAFLSDFVGSATWAHMDIAGTSWNDTETAYAPPGGTGEGVGTLVGLVRRLVTNTA